MAKRSKRAKASRAKARRSGKRAKKVGGIRVPRCLKATECCPVINVKCETVQPPPKAVRVLNPSYNANPRSRLEWPGMSKAMRQVQWGGPKYLTQKIAQAPVKMCRIKLGERTSAALPSKLMGQKIAALRNNLIKRGCVVKVNNKG